MRKHHISHLPALAALLALTGFATRTDCQTIFATVVGAVTDSSSAVVPNAKVSVRNLNTNESREARTNEFGSFEINNLFPGVYTLEVEVSGFATYRREGIQLSANQNLRVDAALQMAAETTSVTVSAEGTTPIETESAKLTDVRNLRQLQTLPTGGRSVYRFLSLTPGVTGGVGGTMSVSGSRSRQVDYAIDGVTFADAGTNNTIGPMLSYIEAFEEVKVDLGNNSAEFKGLGTLSVVSKRGGNQLHGSVFDYYSTGIFRADDWFSHRHSGTPSHGFGASASGPVYLPRLYDGRNRTFWYYSYETNFSPMISTSLQPAVPLTSWKRGDFSGERTVVRDPFSNTPFPGNRIPDARISSVAKIYLPFWPEPNYGDPNIFAAQNYRTYLRSPIAKPINTHVRGDHRISNANTVFGRMLYQRSPGFGFESGLPGTLGMLNQVRRVAHFLVSDTHIFSPTLINEFRFGIAFNTNPLMNDRLNGPEFIKQSGLQNATRDGRIPDVPQIPLVSFTTGAAIQAISPSRQRLFNQDLTYQWQDTVSRIMGKHSLRAGVEISQRNRKDQNQSTNLFGSFSFSNRYTGFNFADFLLGIPTTISRAPYAEIEQDETASFDFFAQDNYKISNSLTLNLGLRYEYHPSWTTSGNRMSGFDPKSGNIVVPDAALPLVSDLFPQDVVKVIGAGQAGVPDRLVPVDKNNFAPRAGLAWRPFGWKTFVVRGGYGVFYDVVARQPTFFGPPFIVSEPSYTNPTDLKDPGFVQWPLAFPRITRLAGLSIPIGFYNDFLTGYAQNWNLTLEKEIAHMSLRVSYVGNGSRKMPWNQNINQPLAGPGFYVDKPRMFPRLSAVRMTVNGASHTYNGLNLEVERRMFQGLMFQSGFTFAKDLGDDVTPENAYDRRRERSKQDLIPFRRWTGLFIYELPFGKGRRFASNARGLIGHAIGGWELSSTWAFQDGQNNTPAWTMPDIHGIAQTGSRTAPLVGYRPDCLTDPNFEPGRQTVEAWYDVSAFRMPSTPGVFGSCGRGIIHGPAVRVMHSSIYKTFSVAERYKFKLGMQATNVTNHPNFSNLGSNALLLDLVTSRARITGAGGATSDTITDTAGPRSLRLDLRIDF